MGMTVKELITRLLDEDMNEEVCIQTTDPKFVDSHNKQGKIIFHIENVEHWNYQPFLKFTDWRVENDD